jgi:phenylpropionate dioxygenase-like ring-hydroxylating dioxygenase large terminal subunit
LIGVLEVLWQGFAFTEEAKIDRDAAKRRSLAFLRSVFPQQFGGTSASTASSVPMAVGRATDPAGGAVDLNGPNVPAWAFSDNALLTLERDRLFRPSWQLIGHEADIPRVGDYLTTDLAGERVLVLRSSDSKIAAFRNNCRKRPHALLTARQGHLSSTIECGLHELVYGLDGKLRSGSTPGDLTPLELSVPGKFILVRALAAKSADPAATSLLATSLLATSLLEIAGSPAGDWTSLPELAPAGSADIAVAADWKLIVEQWLEALPRPTGVRRTFLPPNQLLEVSSRDALVLQVIPESPGHCRIRCLTYAVAADGARQPRGALRKRGAKIPEAVANPAWLQQDIEVAESTQAGLAAGIDVADDVGPVSTELAEFRRTITVLLPMARSGR